MKARESLLHGGLWHRMRRSGDCYLLVAPYLLFFTVFTVVPVLVAMGFSFTQFNMLETPSFIGLKNYAHMFFTDDNFPKSLRNTLVFALLTGPLSYGICLFFAWMINEMPRQLRWLITLIF